EAGLGVGVLGGAPAGVGGLGVGLGGVAAGGGVAGPGGLGVGVGLEVVRLGLVVPRGAEGFQALGEAGALGLGGLEPGAGAGGGVAGGVAGGAGLLGGRLGGGDVGGVEGGAGGLGGGLGLRQPRLGGLQRRAHALLPFLAAEAGGGGLPFPAAAGDDARRARPLAPPGDEPGDGVPVAEVARLAERVHEVDVLEEEAEERLVAGLRHARHGE